MVHFLGLVFQVPIGVFVGFGFQVSIDAFVGFEFGLVGEDLWRILRWDLEGCYIDLWEIKGKSETWCYIELWEIEDESESPEALSMKDLFFLVLFRGTQVFNTRVPLST